MARHDLFRSRSNPIRAASGPLRIDAGAPSISPPKFGERVRERVKAGSTLCIANGIWHEHRDPGGLARLLSECG